MGSENSFILVIQEKSQNPLYDFPVNNFATCKMQNITLIYNASLKVGAKSIKL